MFTVIAAGYRGTRLTFRTAWWAPRFPCSRPALQARQFAYDVYRFRNH